MKKLLCCLVLLALPGAASAAGFAKQSLFLSKSSVTEGDVVLIHAIVQNDSAAKFSGEVVFKDGDIKIGSVPAALGAGEAQAVSVSWKPAAGTHTVTSELETGSGEVIEKQSSTFSVAAKPSPVDEKKNQPAAAVESSDAIQQKIGEYSPAAGGAVAPVFTLIDGGRQAAADALDRGLEWSKAKVADRSVGEVLGSTVSNNNVSDPAGAASGVLNTLWFVLATLLLYVFSILRWLVGSAGVFYPAFAVLVLYMLWRLIRRFRRPAY